MIENNGNGKKDEIYNCIIDYICKNKYPPTIREIGNIVNLKSPSTIHSHLTRMQIEGKITFRDESPRTIVVPGYAFVKIPEGMTEADVINYINRLNQEEII